jgi:hypothetical protein
MPACRSSPSVQSTPLASLRERIAAARETVLRRRRNAKPTAWGVHLNTEKDIEDWIGAVAAGDVYELPDLEPLWMDAAEVPGLELPSWTSPRSGPAVVSLLDALARCVERAATPGPTHEDDRGQSTATLALPAPRMPAPEAAAFCDVSEASSQKPGRTPAPKPTASAGAAPDSTRPVGPEDGPRVILRGHNEGPIVLGKEKPPLTLAQHDAVKALLNAGERGLSKDDLDRKSGHGDTRKTLKRLAASDPDWKAVIHFPGKPGRGYSIG